MARKKEEKVREKGRKRKKETPIQDGREDTEEVGGAAK